jgi:hypothetical protein
MKARKGTKSCMKMAGRSVKKSTAKGLKKMAAKVMEGMGYKGRKSRLKKRSKSMY